MHTTNLLGWVKSIEAVKASGLVVQLKLKCLLVKPTHDGTFKGKEVYIQLSFERYNGKLMLHI